MMNVKVAKPSLAYHLSYLAVLLIGYSVKAQLGTTVVGCGGFIRWHSPSVTSKIDYQQLKVNLYLSESDKLKDVTEVLPNGAFSVPLYDKGPYRLKLATPTGWYVTPADGYLLDLRTNPQACSNDFNFEILGFTVTGRVVTFGLDTGPSDLVVRLTSVSDGSEIYTHTFAGGNFGVGPVIPGEYILTVSDGEQIMTENVRARQTVSVGATNVALHEAVVLLGHFVRGDVTDFDGKPFSGVTIYLLTTSSTANIDCTRIPEAAKMNVLIPPPLVAESVHLACETITDVSGQFSFNRLPGGEYILLPHHSLSRPEKSQPSAQLSFEPSSIRITVAHNDIQLDSPAFHTNAFQLPPGRLMWPNGQPIRDAKIFLGDSTEAATTSDHNGFYQIGFIQPGQFIIHVVAEDAEFANVTTNLSAVTEHLPNFEPIRFSVCGQLDATDDLLNGQYQFDLNVQIKDLKSGSVSHVSTQSHPHGFRFCALLNPGRYELLPDVHTKDSANQPVVFSPSSHFVEVSSGPVRNVAFSQFTAKVSGRITCLVPCASAAGGPFVVKLLSTRGNDGPSIVRSVQPKFNSKADKTGDFEFDRVFPGAYHVVILSPVEDAAVPVEGWCWSSAGNSRVIRVTQSDLHWRDEPNLDFSQTGFTVRVIFDPPPMVLPNAEPELILSASVKVVSEQQNDSSSNTHIHWKIGLHPTKVCLPFADKIYSLSVSSPCFKLNQPSPSQIRPARDCSPVLIRSPLVRLTVAQLPLLIQLSHSHIFDPAGHAALTGTPMMVNVTHLTDSSTNKMIRKVMAQWSNYETGAVAPPVAQALIWIDTHQTVCIKPQMSTGVPGRWFYTQIVPADAAIINLSATPANNTEANTDLVEYAPLTHAPSHSQPTTPVDFARCSPLYHSNLTIRFPLELGVTLYGKIIPPIEKVEVKLFSKQPPSPGSPSSSHIHEPLLPIHATESNPKDPNTSQENAASVNVVVDHMNSTDRIPEPPVATAFSQLDGTFLFGPIPLHPIVVSNESAAQTIYRLPTDPTEWFTLKLNKPGYEFTALPPSSARSLSEAPNWQFKATKLSLVEVLVHFLDEQMSSNQTPIPLQGVLISIIGEGHRGNQFTDSAGLAHFVGLAPGQYYLRPMMKEYLFTVIKPKGEQAGQASPITVFEGISVHVEISAKRVAFALSGLVTFLARVPAQNVIVEAKWISNPSPDLHLTRFPSTENLTCPLNNDGVMTVPLEQAWTNETGQFEIRGLFPGCVYAVAVQTTEEFADPSARDPTTLFDPEVYRESVVERAIPEVLHVLMAPRDTTGLSFFAIRPFFLQTLTVSVDTADEFFSTLHLTLFPLDRPDRWVVKHDFSVDSILFTLTGLKLASIVGHDHILRLESTLESKFYTNIAPQDMVVRLRPGKSEHLQFTFRPKLRSVFPEYQSASRDDL